MYFIHAASDAEVFEIFQISDSLRQRGLDVKEFKIKDIKTIASLQGANTFQVIKENILILFTHRETVATRL